MPDHRDILATCLAEIEAGTSSIEECAARYPEMTGLADQLRMALALRELPPVTMSDVRKIALERRLLQVMETRSPVRHSPLSVLRPIVVLAAVLILVSLAAFGVARASRSSLPGDFLYSYKRGVEQVELNFAGASRPAVLTTIAESRLHELESVVIRDQRVDDKFVDEVTTAVNAAMRATSDPIQQLALYTKAVSTYNFAASQGVDRIALATVSLVTPEPTRTSPVVVNPTASVAPSATLNTATATASLTSSPSSTATVAPTDIPPTATQTDPPIVPPTSTPSVTVSATSTETPHGSGLVTATALPSFTPSSTPTPTIPTNTPTITDIPTDTPVIPTLMYPTVTATLTYTFTPIGGNITILPPTNVPPTAAAPTSGSTDLPIPTTNAPTDSPSLTPTATSETLLPCSSLTPTPTAQLVDGATITPSPTETLMEGINQPAQAPTMLPCLTLTPTPTAQSTDQPPTQ